MLVCAGAEGLGKLSFVTCTSPIMHHVYAPKFYITFVFHFSIRIAVVPREIEDKVYAKFLGRWANKVRAHCGKFANDE